MRRLFLLGARGLYCSWEGTAPPIFCISNILRYFHAAGTTINTAVPPYFRSSLIACVSAQSLLGQQFFTRFWSPLLSCIYRGETGLADRTLHWYCWQRHLPKVWLPKRRDDSLWEVWASCMNLSFAREEESCTQEAMVWSRVEIRNSSSVGQGKPSIDDDVVSFVWYSPSGDSLVI